MSKLKDAILAASPSTKNIDLFCSILEQHMAKYNIDTPSRQAMFIAQLLHESASFRYTKEIWGPSVWQRKYEGHIGLGNILAGDGKRFLGRGLIQLTGRKNYKAFSEWIKDPDIMVHPEVVELPDYAVLSAIWYWTTNNLNRFADKNDIEGCTKAVNGAKMLGLAERKHFYELLLERLQS